MSIVTVVETKNSLSITQNTHQLTVVAPSSNNLTISSSPLVVSITESPKTNLSITQNTHQLTISSAIVSVSSMENTFETVNKNLKAFSSELIYLQDRLSSIVYSNGVIKTLNWNGDTLSAIVLSGNTPTGIQLSKHLNYFNNKLTSITYS